MYIKKKNNKNVKRYPKIIPTTPEIAVASVYLRKYGIAFRCSVLRIIYFPFRQQSGSDNATALDKRSGDDRIL